MFKPSEWPDPVRRAVRTFIQSWIGLLLLQLAASGVTQGLADGKLPDVHLLLTILVATLGSAVISSLSLLQNALEDSSHVPLKPMLKRPSLKQQAQGRGS